MQVFPSQKQWRNPYPFYADMRRHHPVCYDAEHDVWALYRYADVSRLLTDHTSFSSDITKADAVQQHMNFPRRRSLIGTDPPYHDVLRAVVNKDFFPRAIGRLEPRIRTLAHDLLDNVIPTGRMDLVHDLSYPLPVTVIAELLGVPSGDRLQFKRWADGLVGNAEVLPIRQLRVPDDARRKLIDEMCDYFRGMIAARRAQPEDDLITRLTVASAGGVPLSEDELLGFCILLLIAGYVTTTNLIGNAVVILLDHPGELAALQADASLLPAAIEEILRYDSPVQAVRRVTAQEITIGGQAIPAGQWVMGWIGSANRDPDKFPDPDRFDLGRDTSQHLAFGFGVHYCLGAPLARLETRIALDALLHRLPDLERTDCDPLDMGAGRLLRGPRHLSLRFRPGKSSTTAAAA